MTTSGNSMVLQSSFDQATTSTQLTSVTDDLNCLIKLENANAHLLAEFGPKLTSEEKNNTMSFLALSKQPPYPFPFTKYPHILDVGVYW